MTRSRLSRRLDKQNQKSIFFSILGIIVVLFILIKFGIPLLINFSLFISNFNKDSSSIKNNSLSFVAPPVLDPLFNATPSAEINISGKALPDQTINLYLNGELTDKKETKDKEDFKFENVILKPGENTIMAKAVTEDNKESNFSAPITVIYKKDPPKLEISSPSDGQSFSKEEKSVNVSGKSDADIKVTVNDFWAIVDTEGNFSYTLKLNDGENKIKVAATDQAGNKTEKEIKVNYSP